MKVKVTLEQLLASEGEKKILFLGKEEIFTHKEIARFLKKYQASMTLDYEEGLTASIEHSKLNPVEEDISNLAYENTVPDYKLSALEKIISETMNDDELLMGIKLANDQSRIFRLLGNAQFTDTLFVKLLGLYEWDDEEEDSREDRDVIMYTLRRYINIKPNEEDLLYSYLTLRRLATEATDPSLLEVLIRFPNFEFLVRGKEKISLRGTIARNEYLNSTVISKLIALRDRKVDVALAGNPAVPVENLEKFLKKDEEAVYKALASNRNINNTIFEALLSKSDAVIELLLVWQKIDIERLTLLEKRKLNERLFSLLGVNETLENDVIDLLIQSHSQLMLVHLAENPTLTSEVLEKLYSMDLPGTLEKIVKNPATSAEVLEKIYVSHKENDDILVSMAYNDSLPLEILEVLYQKNDFEINKGLATNASLPMEMLDVLKVDTRLQNYLSQNKVFIKEYETVLDYDKNAVQF